MLATSATELTTAATDAVLAVESAAIAAWLWRPPHRDRLRAALWSSVLGLAAIASLLGAVAHGLALPAGASDAIWVPLYLCLGVAVALFPVAAVHDWRGAGAADGLLPWAVALGVAFAWAALRLGGAFILFVGYEAAMMLAALAIYAMLAARRRVPGAAAIAAATLLNLAAAGVQASGASLRMVVPFDHNGLFHLVQMAATALLGFGVSAGLRGGAARLAPRASAGAAG